MSESEHVYHEKQKMNMCALHMINMILQSKAFDDKSLDEICKSLDPSSLINRHKSIWGVGDYDINVIELALYSKGYELHWLDQQRIDPGDLNFSKIFGMIVNVPSRSSWTNYIPFVSNRHWYAIRDLPTEDELKKGLNHFWILDSAEDKPSSLGSLGSLLYFLRNNILKKGFNKHLILVLTKDIAHTGAFKRKALTTS